MRKLTEKQKFLLEYVREYPWRNTLRYCQMRGDRLVYPSYLRDRLYRLANLKKDKKLLVFAAAQAQKAADFILGRKYED